MHIFPLIPHKNRAFGGLIVYRHSEYQFLPPDDFFLPFGGRLNPENRWVKLTFMIPWVATQKLLVIMRFKSVRPELRTRTYRDVG